MCYCAINFDDFNISTAVFNNGDFKRDFICKT